MTIAELIQILSELNGTTEVCIYDGEYESYNPINRVEVKLMPDGISIIALY